jgi:hypothetical protein
MTRRRGVDDSVNQAALLAALRDCRHAIVREMPNMKPMGPLYHFASGVMAAIDALAMFITRDPTFFHDKGTTSPPARWEGEER